MKRYEETLKETQRALELESDNAEYQANLSVIQNEMDHSEETNASNQEK